MIDAQEQLLIEVEAFLRDRRMADSTFGKGAVNDWRFVKRLRERVNMTARTMHKARVFMANLTQTPTP